jgi:acylglycerol lipase
MNSIRKIARTFGLFFTIGFISCTTMKNLDRPLPAHESEGIFHTLSDGTKIFVYTYLPKGEVFATIYVISGITGINHNSEKDIIEQLSNGTNRVVVIHPRGTGYSDGKRGDITDFSDFINDYVEIIRHDKDYIANQRQLLLFGHSMSSAILLAVADNLEQVGGAILVNPAYIRKEAKGMSPSMGDYLKYAWYFVFTKHKPIVNMAGDPSRIENEEDRKESEERINDPLLVRYFSLYLMNESKKLMDSMLQYCKKANYPLLLIYGLNDSIVDKKGCDLIFENWNSAMKQYSLIENGAHGKSTVKLANKIIHDWIKKNYKS